MTTDTKASTTIQLQGAAESYKFNKFQNFDGISHGTFVLSHGTVDGVTGQHSFLTGEYLIFSISIGEKIPTTLEVMCFAGSKYLGGLGELLLH